MLTDEQRESAIKKVTSNPSDLEYCTAEEINDEQIVLAAIMKGGGLDAPIFRN